jgi:hypothetical protein
MLELNAGAGQLLHRRVGFLMFAENGDDGFILKHRLLHDLTQLCCPGLIERSPVAFARIA